MFLAGDAAHQQPPFIGQGMCQGVRDVTNLCWKLVSVVRGEAGEALLDTYESERSQHVRTLTERIKLIGAAICERDPEAARLRDEALLRQGGGKAVIVTRQEIVPPLQTGFLAPGSGSAKGKLFPQPTLSTYKGRVLLDHAAGMGWRLFWDGRHGEDCPDVAPYGIRAVALGGKLSSDSDGLAAGWFERHDCMAAIVRPDHYVYGVLRRPELGRRSVPRLADSIVQLARMRRRPPEVVKLRNRGRSTASEPSPGERGSGGAVLCVLIRSPEPAMHSGQGTFRPRV